LRYGAALCGLCAVVIASEGFAGESWINLFNGKNLSGWTQKAGDARFYVQHGCIIGEEVSEGETNSVLGTQKDYSNFILKLDFKVDHQLFSGVQVRSQYAATAERQSWRGVTYSIPAGNVFGYLVLIDPSPNHRWWTASLYDERWWTAGIYDEKRRLWLYPGALGGNPDDFSAQGRKIFKTNDWNHLRIEAVGPSLRTFLNGVECAQIKDSMDTNGFIGLQVRDWISDDDHQTLKGAKVRFKNIRLKPVSYPVLEAKPAAGLQKKTNYEN
jgi:hypothetical protein